MIVLNAESLEAFTLGLEINGQLVAPNLTAFSRQSLHFTHFYDQTQTEQDIRRRVHDLEFAPAARVRTGGHPLRSQPVPNAGACLA